MANPRKFSEKIALHNQKQAEETAAFEAIMREVTATTRQVQPKIPQQTHQHVHLTQPQLGIYRGGSLPNVNQTAIDLQGALHSLEDMKQASGRQSLIDRYRQRQMTHRRPFPFDKRTDCSPYGAAYLSPPSDSWRRTNSDSALHTSAMGQQLTGVIQGEGSLQSDNLNMYHPQHCQTRPKSCEVPGINIYPSPEQGQSIPISNNTGSLPDLTTIQFPSPLTTPLDTEDHQSQCYKNQGNHTALTPNQSHHHTHMGGSMSTQQHTQSSPVSRRRPPSNGPSPLVLQGDSTQVSHSGVNNISPQGSTLEANVGRLSIDSRTHQYHPYSGVQHHSPHRKPGHHSPNRQGSPSHLSRLQVPCTLPVQLQNFVGSNNFVVSSLSENGTLIDINTPDKLEEQNSCLSNNVNTLSPSDSSHLPASSQKETEQFICQNGGFPSNSLLDHVSSCNTHPKIVISAIDDPHLSPDCNRKISKVYKCSNGAQKLQGSPLTYRNSQSDCPPSPNSPVSPHSFSPSQSPGLPSTTQSGTSFTENNYFSQQQVHTQATNALQHQFEQFNMIQDNPVTSDYKSVTGIGDFSQASPITTVTFSASDHTDYNIMRALAAAQQNHVFYNSNSQGNGEVGGSNINNQSPHHSPHPPGSPQLPPSPHSPLSQTQQHQGSASPAHLPSPEGFQNISPQMSPQSQPKKIPDIIFTGADDMLARQDFAKELGNAMANMNDFDTELFPSDEALKAGLDPLDLDGLQMLTDPNIVTDAATEDSFRLDRL